MASAIPEQCHISPSDLGRGAVHILRVEVLSTQPTDGTYSDEVYGQGEFDTVRLVEVLKSPIHWDSGHVFRVHPFPGERNAQKTLLRNILQSANITTLCTPTTSTKNRREKRTLLD